VEKAQKNHTRTPNANKDMRLASRAMSEIL
jgi:hypothetical protein